MNSANSAGAPRLRSLLFIEDDATLAGGLVRLLTARGYQVHTAHDGQDGFRVLATTSVELVITDLYMPVMDGLQTIVKLRREFPKIRIIAVSGGSWQMGIDCLQMAKTLGADLVLPKPLFVEELVSAIRALERDGELGK